MSKYSCLVSLAVLVNGRWKVCFCLCYIPICVCVVWHVGAPPPCVLLGVRDAPGYRTQGGNGLLYWCYPLTDFVKDITALHPLARFFFYLFAFGTSFDTSCFTACQMWGSWSTPSLLSLYCWVRAKEKPQNNRNFPLSKINTIKRFIDIVY